MRVRLNPVDASEVEKEAAAAAADVCRIACS